MGHCHSGGQAWAAAGFVDTLLRCEDETGDGYGKETAIRFCRIGGQADRTTMLCALTEKA